jgi:hypothetical protein
LSFFNKKEDVIDIQLTQYGKLLLSKGRFKPEYYCFFDDDILYDSDHAGVTENQNKSEDRIKETPYVRPQNAFYGIETKYSQMNTDIREGEAELYGVLNITPDNEERENALRYPLYNGLLGVQQSTNVTVSALGSPFTGSLSYYSGSNVSFYIPQLTCESEYTILKTHVIADDYEFSEDIMQDEIIFQDGTMYKLIEGAPMQFKFIEENAPFQSENFEVQVFEVVSGSASADEQILLPLFFENCPNPLADLNNYFEISIDTVLDPGERRGLFVSPSTNPSLTPSIIGSIRRGRDTYRTGIPIIGDECE